MIKFRKYISFLLVVALICSILPSYAGASANGHSEDDNKNEVVKTENLKEILKERTPDTKTFSNGDGNFVKEVYPEEIHNKVGKNYQEISENLVKKNKTGYLETEATNLQAEFPEDMKDNSPIVYSSVGNQLSFNLSYATDGDNKTNPSSSAVTEQSENVLTYKTIYKDIDLRHITLNKEVKEDWIMNKYNGINEFHYDIKTDLFGHIEEDGSIGFYETEAKEKKIFELPKPIMVDSNYNETLGDGVRSTKIEYELNKKSDGVYDLGLKANKDWLASSKRVFPIYIDPSVSIDALGDTFVMSAHPKNNYNKEWDPSQGEYVLKTGYYDSTTGTNYSFVKFTGIADLKGATIDSADLSAFVTHSYYADTKTGIWVDEVKGQWYVDELTWNNKPSSTNITSTTVGRDEWANFNVKDTIQAWASGERSNYGFKFHTNGKGKTYWKKITAAESAKKAKLVVAYHYDQMTTPTMTTTVDNITAKTGSVNVKWKSVYGATAYKLQMFDGYRYETVYTGSALSWTSKGKKMFPKAPYTSSSRYSLDGKGTELPVDPSAFYSANLGSTTTTKHYKFRVVPVYPTGDGPSSTIIYKALQLPAGEPDLPIVTTGAYSENDKTNSGRGWLNVKWNKVANATGYKVRIWNGKVYKNYTVGKDSTSISTKGKKLWPTDAQIKAGITDLQDVTLDDASSIGKGAELPIDPSTTYGNSTRRYSVQVIAMSAAGDSPSSDVNYGYMPTYAPKDVTIKSNDDNLVQNKTSLSLSWEATVGARFYDIILSDGKNEEVITVRNKTSYTTKANYDLEKTYTATVQAYVFDDDSEPESEEDKIDGKRGVSPFSSKVTVKPDMREDLIGLEDYFTYEDQDFGNASASINVTTGNMVLQFTDESLYTRSDLGYSFIRTYNSRSTKNSVLGKGWTFIGNETLTILENGDASYTDEDGTVHLFKKDGDQFTSPKGLYENLEKVNSTTYTMTDKNQFVQTFEVGQKSSDFFIASYKDEYDNQIDFERNEIDQLTSISETKGIEKKEKIGVLYKDNKVDKVQYGDHWTKFEYTGDLLTQTTIGSDNTQRRIVENFTYNGQGQMDKYIDGKKNNTVFSYKENEFAVFDQQASDNELSVTNTYTFNDKENVYRSIATDDSKTAYNRDVENNTFAVSEVTEDEDTESSSTTTYELDAQYNIVKLTNPDGTTVENNYDAKGNLLTSTSSEGTVTNEYNDLNQIKSSTGTSGEVTTYEYEGISLKSSTVKDETTTFTYDSYGRITKSEYPNNTFETTKYDDDQYMVTSTDKKGNSLRKMYTIYGQEKEVTDADGKITKYTYDPLYQDTLNSVTDGNGNKTAYTYDDNNNMSSLTDALGRTKKYSYNDNDQVTNVTMPQMTFRYEYDLNGEMSKSILPSGIATIYSYTDDGQVDTVQVTNKQENFVSSTQYHYDSLGNLSEVTLDDQVLKEFGYESGSNLLKKYKLGAFTQNYAYDDKKRITSQSTTYDDDFIVKEQVKYKEDSDDVNNVIYELNDEILHDYEYNQNLKENQNTVTLNEQQFKQVFQMDDSNLLSSLTYTTKKQQPFEITYDYTKNGNISKVMTQDRSTTYTYDGNNQLTKETFADGDSNNYEYDVVGNRKSSHVKGKDYTFSYNAVNQIIKKNEVAYQYDVDGNLVQDENYVYSYNDQQQLTTVKTLSGDTVANYTYDERGLRLTKTIGHTTYEYFYNDEVLDMEIVKENNTITQYRSYEWNGFIPLGMIVKEKDENGNFQTNAYQFITNHRGDVLNIRDAEDKEVGSYQYDAYGNILSVEGDIAKANSVRYAGYYYDDETKNYYLQARYYNPENGAFLALDPHPGDDEDPLSQNGYTYADNNPVMNVDPNGQDSKRVLYAVATGLAFILHELAGNFIGVGKVLLTLVGYIAAYKGYKKAKKASDADLAEKIMKNDRAMRKDLIKKAKKALRKKGIKLLAGATGLGWAVAMERFGTGAYYGYSKKFYNDGLCKSWGKNYYSYAAHVAAKKA